MRKTGHQEEQEALRVKSALPRPLAHPSIESERRVSFTIYIFIAARSNDTATEWRRRSKSLKDGSVWRARLPFWRSFDSCERGAAMQGAHIRPASW